MSELVNERDTYYLDTADRDLKRILNTPERITNTDTVRYGRSGVRRAEGEPERGRKLVLERISLKCAKDNPPSHMYGRLASSQQAKSC